MDLVETSRLLLRPFEQGDIDALAAIFADPDVMKYIGDGKPESRERTSERLEFILDHYRRFGFGLWAAVDKSNATLIGFSGLIHLDNTTEVEVGYRLARDYWGLGLATEGARASLRYGFEELGLERIVAIVHPENLASMRVIQKCSLRYERDARYYNVDVKYYAIDRNQFLPDDSAYTKRTTAA